MTSRHDRLVTRVARPTLMRHLGDRGLDGMLEYRRPDGQPGGYFEAILGPERHEQDEQTDGRTRKRVRTVKIPRQDGLPFWNDPPSTEGTFVYHATEYAVGAVESVTENFAAVELVRIESVEQSRPGFRHRG